MKFSCFGMFLCFLLTTAAPAWGATQEFCVGAACYTADVPAQWKAENDGSTVFYLPAPDNTTGIQVVCREYLQPDASLLARKDAKASSAEDTLRALPASQGDGQCFGFQSDGERIWLMESGGLLVKIRTTKAHKDLRALLSSFKARDGNMARVFTTLTGSPAVLDWLSFTGGEPAGSPLPPANVAGMPDFSRYGTIESEKGTSPVSLEFVPDDWTRKTIGQWVVVASADGKTWGAARLYPIADADKNLPDGAPLVETAKDLAARIGGRNFLTQGDDMFFVTPSSEAVLTRKTKTHALLSLYGGDDAEMWLMGFVQ